MMDNKNLNFSISPVQLKILHYLLMHSKDIVFQRDIEKAIDYRRSTTSGILNTMEKNNLIKNSSSRGCFLPFQGLPNLFQPPYIKVFLVDPRFFLFEPLVNCLLFHSPTS